MTNYTDNFNFRVIYGTHPCGMEERESDHANLRPIVPILRQEVHGRLHGNCGYLLMSKQQGAWIMVQQHDNSFQGLRESYLKNKGGYSFAKYPEKYIWNAGMQSCTQIRCSSKCVELGDNIFAGGWLTVGARSSLGSIAVISFPLIHFCILPYVMYNTVHQALEATSKLVHCALHHIRSYNSSEIALKSCSNDVHHVYM